MSDEPNGTLSRWSQRKLAARRGAVIDEPPPRKKFAGAAGAGATGDGGPAKFRDGRAADETEISKFAAGRRTHVRIRLHGFPRQERAGKPAPRGAAQTVDQRSAVRLSRHARRLLRRLQCDRYADHLGADQLQSRQGLPGRSRGSLAKLEPENSGEAESKSSAESPGEPTSDEDSVADEGPDKSRQLAAAAPEAGEFPQDSETTDRAAPVDRTVARAAGRKIPTGRCAKALSSEQSYETTSQPVARCGWRYAHPYRSRRVDKFFALAFGVHCSINLCRYFSQFPGIGQRAHC